MAMTGVEIEAPFLAAAGGRASSVTPVWFMRQAGRYMAEYRAIRTHHSLLEICARPELAAAVLAHRQEQAARILANPDPSAT